MPVITFVVFVVAIITAVVFFWVSQFRHRLVPIAQARIDRVSLDPNRIVAVEKVAPSAVPTIDNGASSKMDKIEFHLPKALIDDMGFNSKPNWVQDVSIDGIIFNSSKGGEVVWDCTGVSDFHSDASLLGKSSRRGWKITVDQAGTSRAPDVWHSNPQITVTNRASGDVYRVLADCDIQVKDFGPMDIRPTGATVRWHAPVRIGSAPAEAEHHSP